MPNGNLDGCASASTVALRLAGTAVHQPRMCLQVKGARSLSNITTTVSDKLSVSEKVGVYNYNVSAIPNNKYLELHFRVLINVRHCKRGKSFQWKQISVTPVIVLILARLAVLCATATHVSGRRCNPEYRYF